MVHKIYLKIVKGRWYISLGCKGYKSTHALNEALSKLIGKNSAIMTFTTEKTELSVYRATVRKDEKFDILELHNINTDKLEMSIEQCSKIFNDFNIGSEFYINYNPQW